jgi:hypothetical protein
MRAGAFRSGCLQPARGVIHPCFPLRGRWGRLASDDERAPSPSLAIFRKTSLGMHPRSYLCKSRANARLRAGPCKCLQICRCAPDFLYRACLASQNRTTAANPIPPRENALESDLVLSIQKYASAGTSALSLRPVSRININDMPLLLFPKLAKLGRITAVLLPAIFLSWLYAAADTPVRPPLPRMDENSCACTCAPAANWREARANRGLPPDEAVNFDCGESLGRSLNLLRSSDPAGNSRPAYSRKSNRVQRAKL